MLTKRNTPDITIQTWINADWESLTCTARGRHNFRPCGTTNEWINGRCANDHKIVLCAHGDAVRLAPYLVTGPHRTATVLAPSAAMAILMTMKAQDLEAGYRFTVNQSDHAIAQHPSDEAKHEALIATP